MSPRNPPVSVFPVLGLQAYRHVPPYPAFQMGSGVTAQVFMIMWQSKPASPKLPWIPTQMSKEDREEKANCCVTLCQPLPSLNLIYLPATGASPQVSPVGGEFQTEQLSTPESTGHVQSLLSICSCYNIDCDR